MYSFKVFNYKVFNKTRYFIRHYQSDNVFGYRKFIENKFQISDKWLQNRNNASNLYRLITAYRKHGHKYAKTNTFSSLFSHIFNREGTELDFRRFGFEDSSQIFTIEEGLLGTSTQMTISELQNFLKTTYCGFLSVEFDYLESEEEREWFALELEALTTLELEENLKFRILKRLIQSQAFDNFMAKKFASVKRYGGEGAESMMVFFDYLFHLSVQDSIEHLVLAMPHRGRLNLLTGLLNYPPAEMFSKLKGNPDFPDFYRCSGDVLSHIISSTNLDINNKTLHVTMLRNPSHLEAVNPVSMGKTRAKQLSFKDGGYGGDTQWGEKVVNIQVHGDAAFTGQGVNQECLELSRVPHFEIGGTVHLIVNNQVGFTTPSERGRSSRYCSDVVKMVGAPVIHVNGDYPEEVVKATKLAFAYQRKFRKDVVIDMNCFRRWGHNEMDDPTFTNPKMYSLINSRRSVPDIYKKKLIQEKLVNEQECLDIEGEENEWLSEELKLSESWTPKDVHFKSQWNGFCQSEEVITTWDTGIDADLLTFLGEKSVKYPEDFAVHPTILRAHIRNRLTKIAEGVNIDWSTAEALAIGSLLFQGYNVRISGQDVGRGTFSQRHAMLVDQNTNNIFIPLNNIHLKQGGFLELANSILSEEAVLGYEYGMSIENPNNLIIWEAQFGDFFNGAQIIFDTFISSAEAKWLYQSGLTILLPHGYDGAGPEHSSARIERFLQLTDSQEDKVDGDSVNMCVCHPSTPSQYFHLLRRQMVRNFRQPLIIFTPKTLLRAAECVSDFAEMVKGNHFKPVIGDAKMEPSRVSRVLLTSGKHYYSLLKERNLREINDTAILRVECFSPFPTAELIREIQQYQNARSFVWCQEEPQNMGAWTFIKRRFENLIGKPIKYCGRPTQAAPAVGIGQVHKQQEIEITTKPFTI